MIPLRNLKSLLRSKFILDPKNNLKRNYSLPKLPEPSTVPVDKGQLIKSHYPEFVKQMKSIVEKYNPLDAGKHLERVLDYNITGGKKNRAQMVIGAFEEIAPESELTEANFTLTAYVGWSLEVLRRDWHIMDGSATRRGQPCWYKVNDIQMTAINDAFILGAATHDFLKKNINHRNCYANLIDAFQKNELIVSIGQNMDLKTQHQDILTFSLEQYRRIVIHKTAHHSIYTPIELAYHLAGYTDLQTLESVKDILYEIGIFFQVQDDFLDCYGNPEETGKIATDIQDGKCTWLIATFLNRANRDQKAILKKSYGKNDEESVQRVKQLYEDINLRDVYRNYEEDAYRTIKSDIMRAKGFPANLCLDLMDKFYKRNH